MHDTSTRWSRPPPWEETEPSLNHSPPQVGSCWFFMLREKMRCRGSHAPAGELRSKEENGENHALESCRQGPCPPASPQSSELLSGTGADWQLHLRRGVLLFRQESNSTVFPGHLELCHPCPPLSVTSHRRQSPQHALQCQRAWNVVSRRA